MKNLTKAIELAKKGGWEQQLPKFVLNTTIISNPDLLDPKFFQALGKSLGWDNKKSPEYCLICEYQSILKEHGTQDGCLADLIYGWEYYWHKFIDHLIAGNSVESYFEELIK